MSVLIIGVVTITALLWTLAASLANECDAEKRQVLHESHTEEEGTEHLTYVETPRAA